MGVVATAFLCVCSVADEKVDPAVDALLVVHNRERKQEKLGPLKLSPKLCESAAIHARDMAKHQQARSHRQRRLDRGRPRQARGLHLRSRGRKHRQWPEDGRPGDGYLDEEPRPPRQHPGRLSPRWEQPESKTTKAGITGA